MNQRNSKEILLDFLNLKETSQSLNPLRLTWFMFLVWLSILQNIGLATVVATTTATWSISQVIQLVRFIHVRFRIFNLSTTIFLSRRYSSMKEIFDRRYPVTSFFLLVTTLVFVLMFLTSGFNYTSAATLYKFGAVYPPAIKAMPEQIWRLFSATFVHIGLEHFLVNMLSLYFLGRQMEDIFGSKQFFFIYLLYHNLHIFKL